MDSVSGEYSIPKEFAMQTPGAFVMLFRSKRNLFFGQDLEVLLVRRKDLDIWNLPGGGFDENSEAEVDAAIRETREETGLNVGLISDKDNKLVVFETFASPLAEKEGIITGNTRHDRFAAYIGVILGGNLRLNEEAREIRWHNIKTIPKNTYLKHATLINIATGQAWQQKRVVHAILNSSRHHKFIPQSINK